MRSRMPSLLKSPFITFPPLTDCGVEEGTVKLELTDVGEIVAEPSEALAAVVFKNETEPLGGVLPKAATVPVRA